MKKLTLLAPLALLIAGIMLALYIWAVRSGQYDDLETPAHRILFDEDRARGRKAKSDAGEQPEPTDCETTHHTDSRE